MRGSSFSLLYLQKAFSINIFSGIYKSKIFRNNLNVLRVGVLPVLVHCVVGHYTVIKN